MEPKGDERTVLASNDVLKMENLCSRHNRPLENASVSDPAHDFSFRKISTSRSIHIFITCNLFPRHFSTLRSSSAWVGELKLFSIYNSSEKPNSISINLTCFNLIHLFFIRSG